MFEIIITTLHISDTTAVIGQDINIRLKAFNKHKKQTNKTEKKKKKEAGSLQVGSPNLKDTPNEGLLMGTILFH